MVDLKRIARDFASLDRFIASRPKRKLTFREMCGRFQIRTRNAEAGLIPFDPDSWHHEQRDFDEKRTGRDIVTKARQIGFTTLELARDVFFARDHEGVQVLVVGHDPNLVELTFLDARRFADELTEQGLAPKPRFSTKRELIWPDNHSVLRVVESGATEMSARKKGRSGTIHRLHCTEVAYWGAADDTMTALVGALTTDAEVVIESTANGASGRFYGDVRRALAGELDGYSLHFWPWYRHNEYRREPDGDFDPEPRDDWEIALRNDGCDDEQIAWWRRTISDLGGGAEGLERALQEFPITAESAFRTTGAQYISAEACDKVDRGIRKPIEVRRLEWDKRYLGDLWIYQLPRPGHDYYVPADVADGGGCLSATGAIERRTGAICAVLTSKTIDPGDLGLAQALIGTLYNKAIVAPERNNMGAATIRALRMEAKYSRVYTHTDDKAGWCTTPSSRPVMWDDLRRAIESGEATTPDSRMAGELRGLTRNEDGKPVHGNGSTDDLFTMWAIGWQLRLRGAGTVSTTRTGTGPEAARVLGDAPRARNLG